MTSASLTYRRPVVVHVYKDYYPPVMGGVEHAMNLMAHGCRDEFDTEVLVARGRGELASPAGTVVINGVPVTRVAEHGRPGGTPFSPAMAWHLWRNRQRISLVHLHHPHPTGDLAYLLAGWNLPAVMTYHSDVVRQKNFMWAYAHLQRSTMRRCHTIMPTSPDYAESSPFLKEFQHKLQVVPLGMQLHQYEETNESCDARRAYEERWRGNRIVFVGRLRYYKGLHHLIAAMPKIPYGSLLIGGTGPEEPRLRLEVARRGLAARVGFLGDLTHAQLVGLLHSGHVFCMPSHLRSEALGLSMIEAMLCGLPAVCCDLPTGVRFVNIHGETGLRVPPEDPDALAQAINTLLENEPKRRQMGQAAQTRAREVFNAETMCDNVRKVYRAALGRAE